MNEQIITQSIPFCTNHEEPVVRGSREQNKTIQ